MYVVFMIIGAVLLIGGISSVAVGATGYYDEHLTPYHNRKILTASVVCSLLGTMIFWGTLIAFTISNNT